MKLVGESLRKYLIAALGKPPKKKSGFFIGIFHKGSGPPPPYFRELWNRCYTFAKTFFLVLFNVFNGESGEGVHRREVVDKVPFQKSFKNHIFVTKITCLSTVP